VSHTTNDNDEFLHALVHNGDFSGDVTIVFRTNRDSKDLYEVSVPGIALIEGRLKQCEMAKCYGREIVEQGKPWTYESYNPPLTIPVPMRVLLRAAVVACQKELRQRLISAMEDL